MGDELRRVVGHQHRRGHAHPDRDREADAALSARRPSQIGRGLRQQASHDRDAGQAGQRLEHHRQADEGPDLMVEEGRLVVKDPARQFARRPQDALHQRGREQQRPQPETDAAKFQEGAARGIGFVHESIVRTRRRPVLNRGCDHRGRQAPGGCPSRCAASRTLGPRRSAAAQVATDRRIRGMNSRHPTNATRVSVVPHPLAPAA